MGALFFVACGTASIPFRYKYYHVSPGAIWEINGAKLLGQNASDDLDFVDCKPRRASDGKIVQKCVVMTYEELTKLVQDYKQTKQELIDCQRGR
jgi:hypothetical protein